MKMANVNTKIFKSLNESEYKELYTPKRTLTEATTDTDEIAEEYKEAYHIDLDWNRVPCVIARDKFLSGWGGAEGKTHYQVVLCGDSTEAANIEDSMKSVASKEGLANIRRDFGVHLSSKVSKAYVVGRYASAWNTLSDSWYENRFDSGKTEDEINQEKDAQEVRRQEKLRQKEQQANESEKRTRKGNLNEDTSVVKANPIIQKPEFWWLDNDTFIMEFGYSRDDDGWYNYMVEYWADDNTYHFLKVYEYDTIKVEFPEEKKNEIIKMMEEKMNEKQVNESEKLEEKYSEKLGGDPEDFIKDVETIKAKLEEIDTNSFGAKLSQQMVWDWIETCDSQISMTKSRFLGESEKKKLKEDEDTIHKMKDCTDDVKVIMALEGDTLELDDMEDWNRLKELAESLSRSQGFYGRLLASMEEAEKEGLSFPIYL